jgi:hypothetical protein
MRLPADPLTPALFRRRGTVACRMILAPRRNCDSIDLFVIGPLDEMHNTLATDEIAGCQQSIVPRSKGARYSLPVQSRIKIVRGPSHIVAQPTSIGLYTIRPHPRWGRNLHALWRRQPRWEFLCPQNRKIRQWTLATKKIPAETGLVGRLREPSPEQGTRASCPKTPPRRCLYKIDHPSEMPADCCCVRYLRDNSARAESA